jgi:hypothetical protein
MQLPTSATVASTVAAGVMVYTSLRSTNRSLVVFTGAKRVRGTTTAPADSKHSMAAAGSSADVQQRQKQHM